MLKKKEFETKHADNSTVITADPTWKAKSKITEEMQDAAHQRRIEIEKQRLEKIEEMRIKEQQVLEEQNKLQQQKLIELHKKSEKLNRIKENQQLIESEKALYVLTKKRNQEALMDKLEKGVQRKNEQLQMVKAKAAAKNKLAQSVASRVQALRLSAGDEQSNCLADLPMSDLDKNIPVQKSKLKKLRSKARLLMEVNPQSTTFGGEEPEGKELIRSLIQKINKNIYKVISSENTRELLNTCFDQLKNLYIESKTKDFILYETLKNNLDERIIDSISMCKLPFSNVCEYYSRSIEFLSMLEYPQMRNSYLMSIELMDFIVWAIRSNGSNIFQNSTSLKSFSILIRILNNMFLMTSKLANRDDGILLLISYTIF
jgi:hypothetical protein